MSRVCGVASLHTLLTRKHLAIELVVPPVPTVVLSPSGSR